MKTTTRGFALVELLVVVGILALLLSLALPAVSSVREAARHAHCLARLRDLGIASHHYHDAHRSLPIYTVPGGEVGLTCWFSVQAQLLPYLEDSLVHELVNLNATFRPPNESGPHRQKEQATAMATRVAAFVCPSDDMPFAGGCNYRSNYGTGAITWRSVEHPDSGNGVFCDFPSYPRRLGDIVDGLSKTAFFAERTTGSGSAAATGNPNDFNDSPGVWADMMFADRVAAVCAATAQLPAGSVASYPYAGKYWIVGNLQHGFYNHILVPNSAVADCLWIDTPSTEGAASARSNHAGGVNVGMGDCSARFVNDAIALPVWRALATRDGLEEFAGQ